MSEIRQYALTVRKTRNPITQTHYLDYLDYLSKYGTVGNVNFEETKGLHCHFILETKERLDYKCLKPAKFGWNVMAVPVYNKAGWVKYCRKDHQYTKHLQMKVPNTYISDPASPTMRPLKCLFTN